MKRTNEHDEVDEVLTQLAMLAPTAQDAPQPATQALRRIQRRAANNASKPIFTETLWERLNMMIRRYKYSLGPALAMMILVVAFAFPTVRVAASDFLGLFRVQKFAAVSISPQQLALLQQVADQGLYPGKIEMLAPVAPVQSVATLKAAAEMVDHRVRSTTELPLPDAITVGGGGAGRLTVNLESARLFVAAAGADASLLPDSLDGAVIEVTSYPIVEQTWNHDGLSLLQMVAPTVAFPADVDQAAIGQAFLQALGMGSRDARRLSQNIDWTSTLLLPIPQELATFSEVSIGGTTGLAITGLNGQHTAIMWQLNGIVYLLDGSIGIDNLLKIAASVQ